MKNNVSLFEKSLITIIIFVFCIIVLIQIFINNNVLDTIRANEEGTAVTFQDSENAVYQGDVVLEIEDYDIIQAVLLVNGEEVDITERSKIKLKLYDEDVVEIKNTSETNTIVNILDVAKGIEDPQKFDSIKCLKGITQLFKLKIEK